jgi:hypothetical protein
MYDDGSALLEMTSDGMEMHMRVEEAGEAKEVDMTIGEGKLIISEPAGKQEMSLQEAGLGASPPFGAPMRMHMSARGEVLSVSTEGLESLSKVVGMDLSQMMKTSETPFPDRELAVGETWEYTMDFPVPGTDQEAEMAMTARLVKLDESGGMRVATISMSGSIDMSGMTMETPMLEGQPAAKLTFDTLQETITGEFAFDVDRGYMTEATYDAKITTRMQMPGAAPAGGTVSADITMRVETTLQ